MLASHPARAGPGVAAHAPSPARRRASLATAPTPSRVALAAQGLASQGRGHLALSQLCAAREGGPLSARRVCARASGGEGSEPLPPPAPPAPLGVWPQPRPWVAVLLEKVTDTVEDALLILRRTFTTSPGSGSLLSEPDKFGWGQRQTRQTLLVIGCGWGAHALVKIINVKRFNVVLVSPRNHFIFTPMLPSTSIGTVDVRSAVEPIRVSNPAITYVEAAVESVDAEAKTALCVPMLEGRVGKPDPFTLRYDIAVLAQGETNATFGVPGVQEHSLFLKEAADALRLRKRIAECFELASLPVPADERAALLHTVVVGGGPTGVEYAGVLSDYIRRDLARIYGAEVAGAARVTLLQSAPFILGQFVERLQERALADLRLSGVDVRLNTRVASVGPGVVTLADGTCLQCGLIVWSTGNAARPLTQLISASLPAQRAFAPNAASPSTKLAVDPWHRVVGASDLLALGDCSRLHGAPLPATAQVAAQQGAYAARLLNRGYAVGLGGLDAPPPWVRRAPAQPAEVAHPFSFLSFGLLAYVTGGSALTQVDAGPVQLAVAGSLAYLLWRSVYLTKQVSTRNRVLILFDWAKSRVFGRDISQF